MTTVPICFAQAVLRWSAYVAYEIISQTWWSSVSGNRGKQKIVHRIADPEKALGGTTELYLLWQLMNASSATDESVDGFAKPRLNILQRIRGDQSRYPEGTGGRTTRMNTIYGNQFNSETSLGEGRDCLVGKHRTVHADSWCLMNHYFIKHSAFSTSASLHPNSPIGDTETLLVLRLGPAL